MTKKEKQTLANLALTIIQNAEILHPPSAQILCDRIANVKDDSEVLDILIDHMENVKMYEIYNRYDHEASVRDIDKLLKIIQGANNSED